MATLCPLLVAFGNKTLLEHGGVHSSYGIHLWRLIFFFFLVTVTEMGSCCYLTDQTYAVPLWCYSGGWWELAGAWGVGIPVAPPE